MQAFRHYVATPVYFGENVVKENAELIASYGRRAFIVTDEFLDGCRNHALDDIKEVLESRGVAYAVNDRTEDNPPVESCVAITVVVSMVSATEATLLTMMTMRQVCERPEPSARAGL